MSKCESQYIGECFSGYQMADTFCYKYYYTSRSTWNEADARCEQDGAFLIKLESLTKLRVVKSIIQTEELGLNAANISIDVWVGARNYSNGFVWKDATGVSSDLWNEGEPSKCADNKEDCVQIKHRTDCYLNTFRCDFQQAFVCQGPKLNQTPMTARQETRGNISIGFIALASVSSVVGLLAVILGVYICLMRKKRRSSAGQHNGVTERSQPAIEPPYDQCSARASHEDHQYNYIIPADYDYVIPADDDGYLDMTAGSHTATFKC
ncbi:hypothetical protein DPMN_032933 [Dreissena polymorpha]|uniref:C-type lectin domain-containing protein n=2 Tax=Dreissena polymorpha TaxID=45954 RepID=A0A9D4M528_DREPO|nr:hypothetical protein DPMN_032933 [Dreissena polymorpha]